MESVHLPMSPPTSLGKRLMRPMLGFKSFRPAAVTLAGIDLMHLIRKGQLQTTGEVCPARQFYSLAG
jgi:putative transposase